MFTIFCIPFVLFISLGCAYAQEDNISPRVSSALERINHFYSSLADDYIDSRKVSIIHEREMPEDIMINKSREGFSIQIRKKPDDYEKIHALLSASHRHYVDGNYANAIKSYSRILYIENDNKLALFGLAESYRNHNKIDLALETYGRMLENSPDNAMVLNNFLSLLSDHHPEVIVESLRNIDDIHYADLKFYKGVAHEKLGDKRMAILCMKDALDIEPNNVLYVYSLAVVLDRSGDRENALPLYKVALDYRNDSLGIDFNKVAEYVKSVDI